MKKVKSLLERRYEKKYLQCVNHTTLDPKGPGAVRIHLVPPKNNAKKDVPYLVFLNGSNILPIKFSWAVLLSAFTTSVNGYDGEELSNFMIEMIVEETIEETKKVYPFVKGEKLKKDLERMIDAFCDVAYGREPNEEIGALSINEYAPFMTAPHRMDLMISSMVKEGKWNCNQKCLHCYAAGQPDANVKELSTYEWKKVICACREACIPQLTFTGGEPTLRDDLVELIEYSKWFVTRLNTNGVLLTKDLCKRLYDASLDSVQITLYSSVKEIHNALVGAGNFEKTVEGIKNAIEAGLNVSINTPLCSLNSDYAETLKFAHNLGVRYVACSGLIPSGNACKENSTITKLDEEKLFNILSEATAFCESNQMEISFTSPGWLSESKLSEIGLEVPACGACLSNMAIAPDGKVIPCQSWLSSNKYMGNILEDTWESIWNSEECEKIRLRATKLNNVCQLKDYNC